MKRLGLTGIKQLSSQPGFGITTTITTVEFRPCLAKPIVPSHSRQTLMQIIGISHHHMLDIFAAFISYPLNWTFLATTNHHKTRGIPLLGASIFYFFYICLLLLKGFEPGEVTAKHESGRRGNPPVHPSARNRFTKGSIHVADTPLARAPRKTHLCDCIPSFNRVRTLSYIRVLGVIELIEFNHSGLFGVVGWLSPLFPYKSPSPKPGL